MRGIGHMKVKGQTHLLALVIHLVCGRGLLVIGPLEEQPKDLNHWAMSSASQAGDISHYCVNQGLQASEESCHLCLPFPWRHSEITDVYHGIKRYMDSEDPN